MATVVGEGVGEGVGPGEGDGVGKGVGEGVGKGVGKGVGDGVGEGVGTMAKGTKLIVPEVASLVTHPVQFVAVRRLNLSVGVMDAAVGYASYILAASPETCGHAMDVPVKYQVWVSLPAPRDSTLVPGA